MNNQLKHIKIITIHGIPTSILFVSVDGEEQQRGYRQDYLEVIKKFYPIEKIEYIELEKKNVEIGVSKQKPNYAITALALMTAGTLFLNGGSIAVGTSQTKVERKEEVTNDSLTTIDVVQAEKVLNPNNLIEVENLAGIIIKEAEQEPGVHISFDQMVKLIQVINGVEVQNADFMEIDNLMYTLMSIDVLDATKLLTGNPIQGKRTPFSTLNMISSLKEREYMSAFLSRREKLLDSYYYNGNINDAQKDFLDFVVNTLYNENSFQTSAGLVQLNEVNPLIQYFSYHIALTAMPLIDEKLEVKYKNGETATAKEALVNINDKSIKIATKVIEVLMEQQLAKAR